MNAFLKWLRNLFCKHPHLRFIRKTSGDENNYALGQGGRFVHECLDCEATVYRNEEINNE